MNDDLQPARGTHRVTRRSVRVTEAVSRVLITLGGLGTILAVATIFLFIVWVVLPLFVGGGVSDERRLALAGEAQTAVGLRVDEYGLMAALQAADGSVEVLRLDDGERLVRIGDALPQPPTVRASTIDGHAVAYGFRDGRVLLGRFGFVTDFVSDREAPDFADLQPGEQRALEDGLVDRTESGQLRVHRPVVDATTPLATSGGAAIRRLALAGEADDLTVATIDDDARLRIYKLSERTNMLTGEVTYGSEEFEIDLDFAHPSDAAAPVPDWLLLAGLGDNAYLTWPDGFTLRVDVRNPEDPQVVEKLDLVAEPGARLRDVRFLLGGSTLLAGDSLGRVRAWFLAKPEEAQTSDGALLVQAKELRGPEAPVTTLGVAKRTRIVAVGYEDGTACVFQVTTEQELARLEPAGRGPVELVCIAPKEDALVISDGAELLVADFEPAHPEASLSSLFGKVWYEGADEPAHVWQSSSGTDDFEPKLGLFPLIFGTLKATFYTMLFGAPLALLAAIYTSEFMRERVKAPIKATIEMMASLPSVVLGFLAAIVVAPLIKPVIASVLAMFATLPLAVLFYAHLWQIVARGLPPGSVARRLGIAALCAAPIGLGLAELFGWGGPGFVGLTAGLVSSSWFGSQGFSVPLPGWGRLVAIAAILPATMALTVRWVGPWVEESVFAGDVVLWLDGQRGEAWGGWLILTLPLAALCVFLVLARSVNPRMRTLTSGLDRPRCSALLLGRFAVATLLTLALAWGFSHLLGLGFDPRGSGSSAAEIGWAPLGTYVQRNALIVGFIMGFAVIPIIYTIAEDALSSVPSHLRLASLGAGATPWQTAVRVIIPTAMSGLFSALMIGLGRAVGETMIVLMATGNTAILDLNIFNGFRTLSANIAVELPEAARDSTHYRTLFLAALVLFALTFAVNTLAEVVRQRFRKRAYQL